VECCQQQQHAEGLGEDGASRSVAVEAPVEVDEAEDEGATAAAAAAANDAAEAAEAEAAGGGGEEEEEEVEACPLF
jgi:hypothetical protein